MTCRQSQTSAFSLTYCLDSISVAYLDVANDGLAIAWRKDERKCKTDIDRKRYSTLRVESHDDLVDGCLYLLQGLAESGLELPKIHWIEA